LLAAPCADPGVPTRDRLRNSRGLKRTETGQRFLEGFEAIRHLRRGGAPGAGHLVRGPAVHLRVRQVVAAIHTLGRGLRRHAWATTGPTTGSR
jgi:hypothetical protein